jgi:hypothetical protein
MKKIIIASALVFGALFACQKPSELDNLVNSNPQSSRSSNDDNSGDDEDFYYNASLVAVKGEKNNDANNKLFEEFPSASEIYEYNLNAKIRFNFLSVPLSSNVPEPVRAFSFRIVQEPITILDAIRRKYSVCAFNTNPQIECVTEKEMQKMVFQAFVDAGYNVTNVSVSVKGDIVVTIKSPTATLASCIATVISYFN